jgi:hypothetical protein
VPSAVSSTLRPDLCGRKESCAHARGERSLLGMCIDCLYAEDIAPGPGRQGRSIEADVLLWGPGGVEVPAVFAWYDEDPWAVVMAFGDGTSIWYVDRELLAAGLARPAGIGDVQFRADPINPRRRLVTFDNPNGRATLAFDTMDVADFIAAVHHEIESAAAEAAAMKGQQ